MCCSLLGKMSEMDSKAMISAWFVWSLKRAPPVKKATAAQRSFEKGPSFKAAFSLSYFWLAAHKSATQTQRDFPKLLLSFKTCFSVLLLLLLFNAKPKIQFRPFFNRNFEFQWASQSGKSFSGAIEISRAIFKTASLLYCALVFCTLFTRQDIISYSWMNICNSHCVNPGTKSL